MAERLQSGLALPYPETAGAGASAAALPYMEQPAPAGLSLGNVAATMAAARGPLPEYRPAPMTSTAEIAYSPSQNKFFVAGFGEFAADDEAKMAQSLTNRRAGTSTALPQGDWQALDPTSYAQKVSEITNPSLGRLFSRGFGRGIDQTQQLAGYGLMLAGAEETGKGIVAKQEAELAKTAPYERSFTDDKSFADWAAYTIGSMGPNIIQSLVTAVVGGAVGGANPFSAAASGLGSIFAKEEVKNLLKSAATKRMAGQALDAAESEALKKAGQIGGAAAASLVNNYGTGAADIFGETVEAGAPNRMAAILGAIPYAALESTSEALLLAPIFKGALNPARSGVEQAAASARQRLAAGAARTAGIAGAEGTAEAGQEAILMAANPNATFGSKEGIDRLVNSFAAGSLMGALGGAITSVAQKSVVDRVGLQRGEETDLTGGANKETYGPPEMQGPRMPASPPSYMYRAQGELPLSSAYNPDASLPLFGAPQYVPQAAAPAAAPIAPSVQPNTQGLPLFDTAGPLQQMPVGGQMDLFAGAAPQTAPARQVPAFTPQQLNLPLEGPQLNLNLQQSQTAPAPLPLPAFVPPAPQATRTGVPVFEPIPQVPYPTMSFGDGKATSGGPMAEGLNPLQRKMQQEQERRQNTAARESEFAAAAAQRAQQENEQRARDYPDARAQAAMQQPTKYAETGADIPGNPMKSVGRRKTIAGMNTLTAAQQENILAGFNSNVDNFFEYVRTTPNEKARENLARLAGVDVKVFKNAKVTETTEPKGTSNATNEGQDQQGGKPKRPNTGGGLQDGGENRNQPSQNQGGGGETGRSNLIDKGRAQPKPVNLKKPVVNVEARNEWDQMMDDKGKGYNALSPEGKAKWNRLYDAKTPLTVAAAEAIITADKINKLKNVVGETAAPVTNAEVRTPFGPGTTVTPAASAAENQSIQSRLEKANVKYQELRNELAELNSINTMKAENFPRRAEIMAKRYEVEAAMDSAAKEAKDAREALEEARPPVDHDGRFSANSFRTDGTPARKFSVGQIAMAAQEYVSKLFVKPTMHTFRDMADLKAQNPALFKRAMAARADGSFETTPAAGYAFGDTIILFSDYFHTEQQLAFVMAHETIGHFGLRAVMPKLQLSNMLNRVYTSDPRVQAAVDERMDQYGISRNEAVEEYLADQAAFLDVSVLARVWNSIKNALNKFGIQFYDDAARMMVSQARRYVRTGGGTFASAETIKQNMERLNVEASGRFSAVDEQTLASQYHNLAALNKIDGGMRAAAKKLGVAKVLSNQGKTIDAYYRSVLSNLQSLNYMARKSAGLTKIYEYMQGQSQLSRSLVDKYKNLTTFSNSGDLTPADNNTLSDLLAYAALYKNQITDAEVAKLPRLLRDDGTIDEAAVAAAVKAGTVTPDEFRAGLKLPNGIDPYKFDVDEKSAYWRAYQEHNALRLEAALDQLRSKFERGRYEAETSIDGLTRLRGASGQQVSRENVRAFRMMADLYRAIRLNGGPVSDAQIKDAGAKITAQEAEKFRIDEAEAFLNKATRVVKEPLALDDWMQGREGTDAYKGAKYDAMRKAMPALKELGLSQEGMFDIQQAIRNLEISSRQVSDGDLYARATIASAYVPFERRGDFQVRVAAYNAATGAPVRLREDISNGLYYGRFDEKSERNLIDTTIGELEDALGGRTWQLTDEDNSPVAVKFVIESGAAQETPDLGTATDYNDFSYVLQKLNIDITPAERARVVTALTNQNARARSGLQRVGKTGWNADMRQSVAAWAEMTAHLAAKNQFQARMIDTLHNTDNWRGSTARLKALKGAMDSANANGTPEQQYYAEKAYTQYAYQYMNMRDTSTGETVLINGKQRPTLGLGERSREAAKELLRWHSEQVNINDSTEDMLSKGYGATVRNLTVRMQLGGSFASAALNIVSLVTHASTFLASYNKKTGFGGGYGLSRTGVELMRASRNVKNALFMDSAKIAEVIKNKSYAKYGLTRDEAMMLYEETANGTLQASQTNALLATARGNPNHPAVDKALDAWMGMFSYTEQFNRRVTALAAYRLEMERAKASGMSDTNARSSAINMAVEAVNTAQGDYSRYNRPKIARGDILQYLFMYKQFVVITTELIAGMSPGGRFAILTMLLIMSGLKGVPFAEDFADLVDTLAQKFGFKMASIEAATMKLADSILPGSSPYVLRGVLDRITGMSISPRVGMGDILPLTGAFKGGADMARELENFFGPIAGAMTGLVSSAADVASIGATAVGLASSSKDVMSVFRDSPVAFMRAVGDTWAYANDGMVTNAQGKVITKDVAMSTYVTRLLGFYPAEATAQNDIVRLSKAMAGYMNDTRAKYTEDYVKASVSRDRERMNEITASVRSWNEAARGTGLEIPNFVTGATRAALAAAQPTAARFLKTAPIGLRPETRDMLNIYGIDVTTGEFK